MKIREAIIKSIEELIKPVTVNEIMEHILANHYCEDLLTRENKYKYVYSPVWVLSRTDKRIKSIKINNVLHYYLVKNEQIIDFDSLNNSEISETLRFGERDLHPLLSTYLRNTNTIPIHSKTICHTKSEKSDSQTWIHPDMVGFQLLAHGMDETSKGFMKGINLVNTFEIYSYELKKEIKDDRDLKEKYFQAVSNSSWANYGYLVAFEIKDNLKDEIKRLNQAFGIGVILLNQNPNESEILYPAEKHNLDFTTIDKLCKINPDFKEFIKYVDNLLKEKDSHKFNLLEEDFINKCCDKCLDDTEIEEYCKKKGFIDEEYTE